ncbi:MAG: hypothetical protein DCC46_06450 [Armatimonadetes bacterium]|nr:MAG: hypothetical protein DCC46_06450 [Armatimonadota bacterium]
MLLAIDVGNSWTSFGAFAEGGPLGFAGCETSLLRNAATSITALDSCLVELGIGPGDFDCILASVVPEVRQWLVDRLWDLTSKAPLELKAAGDVGLTVDYEHPETMGSDRVANALEAIGSCRLPAIVVDCGTATTFEVLTPDGALRGGPILAGIEVSLQALSSKTSLLPQVGARAALSPLNRSTADAMVAGAVLGHAHAVVGLVGAIEAALGSECVVVLTGGLGGLIAPHCPGRFQYDPHWTLRGLVRAFERLSGPTNLALES